MKARATQRVDLAGSAKQRDTRGNVGVDVLVGPDGAVICTVGFLGHPMVLKDVEDAVRQWKFKPLKENNKPVAFVGNLYFALCNIGCTEAGRSMTLLAR
jgi:outer membrane biosynthesis protein TonB